MSVKTDQNMSDCWQTQFNMIFGKLHCRIPKYSLAVKLQLTLKGIFKRCIFLQIIKLISSKYLFVCFGYYYLNI